MKRRNFFKLVGAGSAAAMLPKLSYAATANVVVVGGGLGGAAVAKYLRAWRGSDDVKVTLITPALSYVSCIQSNLVVTGAIPASRITRNYSTLQSRYNVTIRRGLASGITGGPTGGTVSLQDGSSIPYDYLVLAPGVKFIPYQGDENATLSYWQGDRALALKTQLDAMVDGDTFVMYIPKGTIKGGQAPYGRACAVADKLWNTSRRACTVKVLDGNAGLPLQFVDAFASFNNIVYTSNVTLNSVNLDPVKNLNVTIGGLASGISYDVANVIPLQKANLDFAKHPTTGISLGLVPAGKDFASVNPQTFESKVVQRIYIVGDAQGTNLPKSGNIAADQAKICASAITRRLAGLLPETSLAVSAVQFNAIRSTSARTAVYAHAGFQWNATANPLPNPAQSANSWVASGAFLNNANGTDSDAGNSASGAVSVSSENYSQGLTWVDTLHDDCYK